MSDDTDLTLIDPPGVDHDDVKDPDHPAWAKTWTRLTGEGPESR